MVGPLIYQEMLLGGRRSRDHILRWVYGGWLILVVFYIFITQFLATIMGPEEYLTMKVCQAFTEFFIWQHFILLILVTPAFVAGGVSDEKTRGTLQYLLTTDLSAVHIIVGKLLGRIVTVLVLALAGLPLFCVLGALGGAEPRLIVGVALLTLEVAVGVSAATFLAAVWSKHTRDAVLGLYAFAVIVLLLVLLLRGPLSVVTTWPVVGSLFAGLGWLFKNYSPIYVLEPALNPGDATGFGDLMRRLFAGLFAWGGLAAVCTALAAWRLRPAYIKQLENTGRRRRVVFWNTERPTVDEEPVRWKERHVEGLAPLPSLKRFPRWLGVTLIAGATTVTSLLILALHLPAGVTELDALGQLVRLEWFALANGMQPCDDALMAQAVVAMLFLSLLVGIRCSGAVSGERERMSWEALLLTPLTAQNLVRGKVWGIMGVSYYYLLAFFVPAFLTYGFVYIVPTFDKAGASVILVPLSLLPPALWVVVTLLAMYYVGAVGIWASVTRASSWRSLLWTMALGYVGGLIVYLLTTPIIFILAALFGLLLFTIDRLWGTQLAPQTAGGFAMLGLGFWIASGVTLMLMFWLASRLFLNSAQKWVAERERTRHWYDEPLYRKPRRRVARMAR